MTKQIEIHGHSELTFEYSGDTFVEILRAYSLEISPLTGFPGTNYLQ